MQSKGSKKIKILYTSDIHANPEHLFTMLSVAQERAVDSIIVGGDIVPHYLPDSHEIGVLAAQALYLENVFIPAVKDFKQQRDTVVYLDLANDDFICNRKIIQAFTPQLVNLLHMHKHRLTDQVDLIGYMVVPPTPFTRKDWEKPDSIEFPFAKGNLVSLDGFISVSGKLSETVIDLTSDDTIENDLAQLSGRIKRPFIFVAHSPPFQTPLDVLNNGMHVGSLSIRKFIEHWSRKDLLIASLHGHIHNAPDRSGSIQTTIEKTICINPGQNEGTGTDLRYVILELDDQQTRPQIRIITHEPQ